MKWPGNRKGESSDEKRSDDHDLSHGACADDVTLFNRRDNARYAHVGVNGSGRWCSYRAVPRNHGCCHWCPRHAVPRKAIMFHLLF